MTTQIPYFSGKEEIDKWILNITECLNFYNFQVEGAKVLYASFFLVESAQQWWCEWRIKKGECYTLEEFFGAIYERFQADSYAHYGETVEEDRQQVSTFHECDEGETDSHEFDEGMQNLTEALDTVDKVSQESLILGPIDREATEEAITEEDEEPGAFSFDGSAVQIVKKEEGYTRVQERGEVDSKIADSSVCDCVIESGTNEEFNDSYDFGKQIIHTVKPNHEPILAILSIEKRSSEEPKPFDKYHQWWTGSVGDCFESPLIIALCKPLQKKPKEGAKFSFFFNALRCYGFAFHVFVKILERSVGNWNGWIDGKGWMIQWGLVCFDFENVVVWDPGGIMVKTELEINAHEVFDEFPVRDLVFWNSNDDWNTFVWDPDRDFADSGATFGDSICTYCSSGAFYSGRVLTHRLGKGSKESSHQSTSQ